ncbi:MAG: DUF3006 domain-containing protein [Desulfitobacteriaceae bacterium]
MKGIIDRFEGNFAVVEMDRRRMQDIPRNQLPANTKEGDVIIEENGVYRIDEVETKKRREEINKLMKDLWN